MVEIQRNRCRFPFLDKANFLPSRMNLILGCVKFEFLGNPRSWVLFTRKSANGASIRYFSNKWRCHWSELVLSMAEYLQFSGTMIVNSGIHGIKRYQGFADIANLWPLKWLFCWSKFAIIIFTKPDTKERLENHFKTFPHRPEETFGRMRFSKEIPCEDSKKKTIYGCLMCHRTFKSSRNCYHRCSKILIWYGPYHMGAHAQGHPTRVSAWDFFGHNLREAL